MSRSLGATPLTTRSPIRMVPWLISSSPAIIRRAVDFPQPEGPTRTMNSPSWISRLRSFTAFTPLPKTLSTSSSVISAIVPPCLFLAMASQAGRDLTQHDGESAGWHWHGDGRVRADRDAPLASLIVVARGDGRAGARQAECAGLLGVGLAVE